MFVCFSPKFFNLPPFFSIRLCITQTDVMHLKWDEVSLEEWMMQAGAGGAAFVPLHPMHTRTTLAVVVPTCELWALWDLPTYADTCKALL